MFDTTGSRLDFTVCEGVEECFSLAWLRHDEPLELTGATFRALAYDETEDGGRVLVAGFPVELTDEPGGMMLSVPAMVCGAHWWEMVSTDSAGADTRLLWGKVSILSTSRVQGLTAEAQGQELRRLAVQVPDAVAAPLVLRWQASSVAGAAAADALRHAQAAALSAQEAAEHAQEAAGSAAAAHEDTELARRVCELWEAKFERVAWCNPETGTWWIYDKDTRAPYQGENGRSPRVGVNRTWEVYDTAQGVWVDTGEPVRGEDGRSPYINAAGNWVRWDAAAADWVDTGVKALGTDGRDGDAIVRHLVASTEEIPQSGETCNGGHLYYVPCESTETTDGVRFYEVYAWLTDGSGAGSWQLVGEKNDVATTEVLGLVKLGTDAPVSNGAPVGTTEGGNMAVPLAGYTVPGTMLASCAETLGTGGACGVDSAGRLWAQPCAFGRFGVGKPSFNGTAEVACVGLMRDGSYGVPWATLTQGGAVKLGSALSELNAIPYVLGVGATRDHALANNLLNGGALQHQRPAAWQQKGMDWLRTDGLEGTAFYLGLVTSRSFTQSQLNGLELSAATVSLLGGVYLARSVSAGDGGAVTASLLFEHLRGNYYDRSDVYRRTEVYNREETDGKLKGLREETQNAYETKEDAAREHERLDAAVGGRLAKTDKLDSIEVMTQEEYNRVRTPNTKGLYIIVEG